MAENKGIRSGFVAILGRPNVGKSSIMNRFVGEKVAIVSQKAQTTRSRILGVSTRENTQIVFVDTPGIHKPRTKLGEYMVKAADDAREGVDAVLVVVDGEHIGPQDAEIMKSVQSMNCPRFLAVNKIDIVPPEKLMPQLAALNAEGFQSVVSVSARTGENVDVLYKLIAESMPEGPMYFPEDMITDQPERVMCAEIIREKALYHLRDEIPHGVHRFTAIFIATEHDLAWPCGICRQVLNEFKAGDMRVVIGNTDGKWVEKNLSQLLPESFGPENLGLSEE